MTRQEPFSEAFWDSDIIGTYGWDTLCRRMKDGRKVCSEIAHYLRDRAKAEQEYAKMLLNLTKKTDGKEEIGGLGDSWQTLKSQTERIAYIHDEASQLFTRLYEELTLFSEEQKREKQSTEETVKKYILCKKNDYTKAMNMKKSYEQKCMDYNNAEENFKTMQKSVTVKTTDLHKAQKQYEKALDNRSSADTAYKSAVQSLESSRRNWEEQTEIAYKRFEELERDRIDLLRNQMWKVANIDSDACVKHDECSEKVRVVLEKCDIAADIQFYVDTNRTGSKRPDPIHYEDYYGTTKGNNSSKADSRKTAQSRPPAPLPSVKQDDGVYARVDENFAVLPKTT